MAALQRSGSAARQPRCTALSHGLATSPYHSAATQEHSNTAILRNSGQQYGDTAAQQRGVLAALQPCAALQHGGPAAWHPCSTVALKLQHSGPAAWMFWGTAVLQHGGSGARRPCSTAALRRGGLAALRELVTYVTSITILRRVGYPNRTKLLGGMGTPIECGWAGLGTSTASVCQGGMGTPKTDGSFLYADIWPRPCAP
jgi:hypothetical protein